MRPRYEKQENIFQHNNERREEVVSLLDFRLCVTLKQPLLTDPSYLSASVGGEIQSLAWDPTGERLAVLLKGLPSP